MEGEGGGLTVVRGEEERGRGGATAWAGGREDGAGETEVTEGGDGGEDAGVDGGTALAGV